MLTPESPSRGTGVTVAALAMATIVAIVGIVAMVIVSTHAPTAAPVVTCHSAWALSESTQPPQARKPKVCPKAE